MPVLTVEKKAEYAIVTLNRPDQMNALSSELFKAIDDAFTSLENDKEVRAIILTGAGRAFTAGIDLKELGAGGGSINDIIAGAGAADPITAMSKFSGPIIGAINGVAVTGGFEIALACDILIASTKARFADTHARVGIIPAWGLSQKLSRLIGIAHAKEISFTGNFVSAEQALGLGLVNRVVEPEELLPVCEQLAEDITSTVPEILSRYRQLIDDGFSLNFGDAMKLEQQVAQDVNSRVTPDDIEARREAIRARGQKQQTS